MTPTASLSDDERLDWLRLVRSDGIGPRTFEGLLGRFGTAAAALVALPTLIGKRGPAGRVQVASVETATREYEQARKWGLRFVALCEPDYPAALRAIDTAPPLICVRGDITVMQKPMVAIVGSRNASGVGLIFTERLARGIGEAGYVVVSGLARGIDAKAHAAALPTGTIAVLAGGHDRLYPAEHQGLARSIAERGAVITEMPLGWEPRGRDFPRRNRIVSGLGLGTVVVEAARRSGSLITARFAGEQGREVFAVPGSPLDPRAEGTNDLLRQGATLCTSADDVIDALTRMIALPEDRRSPLSFRDGGTDCDDALFDDAALGDVFGYPDVDDDDQPLEAENRSDDAQILALLGPAPTAIDDLVRLSGLGAARVLSVLTDLEVAGIVERLGGARVSLTGR